MEERERYYSFILSRTPHETVRDVRSTARQDIHLQFGISPFFLLFLEEKSFKDYRNALARLQGARAGLPQLLNRLIRRWVYPLSL
jgi:hypothetical protein